MGTFSLTSRARPLIVAGPCGAESRVQTLETCRRIAETGAVHALRAGIWKPRTAPGSFEGAGEEGLRWLAEAKRITGLPAAVEVATAEHVQMALSYGVEILWIGARTTVNPFAVQEAAEALRGNKEVTVLVKNPMNPDLDAWAGAVARFMGAGVPESNIGLVHRGFAYYGEARYRNAPMWHLAFEMRSRFPDMTMLCDPSHIAGRRELLREVAQTAADMRFDGLMVESHIAPAEALSDSAQQVTPEELAALLAALRWRKGETADPGFGQELERLRSEIDQIDSQLLELMGRRMNIAERIGELKLEKDVAILQGARWNTIVRRAVERGRLLGLSEEFIRSVLESIHSESIGRQNSVMNK